MSFDNAGIYSITLLLLIFLIDQSGIIGKNCVGNYITYMPQKIYHKKEIKIWYLFLAYAIYIFLACFRRIDVGYGGTDIYGYYRHYMDASTMSFKEYMVKTPMEYGYSLLVWLFSNWTGSFRVFLAFCHSICFWCLSEYAEYLYLPKFKMAVLFVIFGDLFHVFNTLRNTLAVCMALHILIDVYRKKYAKAVLIFILTVSIHISAIVALPIIIFNALLPYRNKVSKGKMAFLTIAGFAISVLAIPIMNKFAESRRYKIHLSGEVAYPVYAIMLFVLLAALIKNKVILRKNLFNKICMVSMPICLFIMPLQQQHSILYRMTLYFMPILMGIYPSVLKAYDNKKKITHCIVRCVLFVYLAARIYKLVTRGFDHCGLPYEISLKWI